MKKGVNLHGLTVQINALWLTLRPTIGDEGKGYDMYTTFMAGLGWGMAPLFWGSNGYGAVVLHAIAGR